MDNEWHKYDMHLYRDSFQNYKVYQIPKAQLIIADVPYNLSTNAYGSNPSWYVDGDFVLFEFDYSTGTYGCGHPLCRPCHECHRANSAEFLAEMIFSTFKNSVVTYDGNLTNYPKETKELMKLCKRACDRIAKEIK